MKAATGSPWVLDTHILLDLWVFSDPAMQGLQQDLDAGRAIWLATDAMREELERVLGYPQIASRLPPRSQQASDVLQRFDRLARVQPVAPRAIYACQDPDDQKFVDLAVAHAAGLLSKDQQVLRMKRRLATLGVAVTSVYAPGAAQTHAQPCP